MSQARPRVCLEIDLGLIRANYELIAAAVEPVSVMAVLKADAYGLGVQEIGRCLRDAGVYGFGTAELNEALALADLGRPVHILGGILEDEIPDAIDTGTILPITDLSSAQWISREAVRQGKSAEAHFLIDTGMGRLGIRLEDAVSVIHDCIKLPGLVCNGIYSHFPFAYGDFDFSNNQVIAFRQLLSELDQSGIVFRHVHMANSDGIHNIGNCLKPPFNLARTGINLYGCFDQEGRRTLALKEVLRLKSRLVAIRDMPWGASLGYGRTHRLAKPTRVGTVAIGYADGLPLNLSNCGKVRIRGCDCPILGRVSMDYTTVSLEHCPEARPGDEVICLGDGITVADWATAKGTITYEIICSFGNRVERRYLA